jgi:enoyl-CoA hydratase
MRDPRDLTDDQSCDLKVSNHNGILHLLIDREEKRNALTDQIADAISAALASPPADARVVLLSSAGPKVFCAGADLTVMTNQSTGLEQHEGRGGIRRIIVAMRECPLPVVVRVQGLCLAGGVGIVLGADLAIAAESAQFGLPEVNLGLWPFMVSVLLAQHTSPKIAMDLMLTARRLPAQEALTLGLVSRVVPDGDLDTVLDSLVAGLAAAAPVAISRGKAAFWDLQSTQTASQLAAMHAQLTLLTQTLDATEGIAAFFDKRAPTWSGR